MKKNLGFSLLITLLITIMLGSLVSAKTDLTIWMHENAAFVDGVKTTIERYEAENPDVNIKLQRFPYDALVQKLKAAFVARTAPDIVQMFGTWVPEYSRNGFLYPAPEGIIDQDNFFDAALGAYLMDGDLYGVPQEFNLENGGVLAYPEKFKAAGIPYPPKTYDELLEAAKQLAVYDDNGNLLVRGFDFISGDNIMFTLLSFILQQDGTYWAEDGVHFNFTSPEAVRAMEEMKDLVVKHHVTDFSQIEKSLGDMDSHGIFFSGDSVMTYRGPWTIPAGLETYKVDNFDYFQMPSLTDNPPYFAAESGWGLVVSKDSKKPEDAWEFIKFATSPEQAMYFNTRSYTVPANKNVAKDPAYLEKLPLLEASLDVLPYGKWIGPVRDRDNLVKLINDITQSICKEEISVQEGLEELETGANRMIDRKLR